jgi:general stress protein YciG
VARPNWEYIRVDVLLPDNPKLDGLSAAAKWTLIELWCHCGQRLSDGFVRDAAWKRFSTAAVRRQLISRGLAERVEGGYQMHDYLDHQRSRNEVNELREKRAAAGRKGGQAKASAKQVLQQKPEQTLKQTAGKPVAEAEAEAEADRSGADAVSHPSRRNARNGDEDEIDLIISEIHLATGRDVSREWAADVRATLMNGRDVSNPAAYLRQIIRTERDPAARFLPLASSHPSARPVSEANLAAGIAPNGTPLRGPAIAAIAAQARQGLRKDPA